MPIEPVEEEPISEEEERLPRYMRERLEQERLAQLARDEEARIALESSIAAQETAQTASASAHSSTIPLIIIILCSLLLLVIISFIIALLVHRLKSNSKK